jgi:hypothetical protein
MRRRAMALSNKFGSVFIDRTTSRLSSAMIRKLSQSFQVVLWYILAELLVSFLTLPKPIVFKKVRFGVVFTRNNGVESRRKGRIKSSGSSG